MLVLKDILSRITNNKIYIYEYKDVHNISENKRINRLDISKEILSMIILKLTIPRDFNIMQSIDINKENQNFELKYSLFDSDSLFNVYLYENYGNHFYIYNGNKISHGNCTLSKNEIMYIMAYEDVKIKIFNKKYYYINLNEYEYLNIIESILELMESNVVDTMKKLNLIIKNFIRSVEIQCRMFVADLILRDYYHLLKIEINRLEGAGYKIKEVTDTNIFFV